jgi:hypothetical protein
MGFTMRLAPLLCRGQRSAIDVWSAALHLGVAAGHWKPWGTTRRGSGGRQILWPNAALAPMARESTRPLPSAYEVGPVTIISAGRSKVSQQPPQLRL